MMMGGLRLRGGTDEPEPKPMGSSGKVENTAILKQRNFSIEKLSPKSAILRARKWNKAVYKQLMSFLKTMKGKLKVDHKPMSKRAALRYIVSKMQRLNSVRIETA